MQSITRHLDRRTLFNLVGGGFLFGIGDVLYNHWNAPVIEPFTKGEQPVAVFVGGTGGIGGAMAKAFGKFSNGNASIIIIGRNRAAGEDILSKLPKPQNPNVKHEFIQCDVTRMKNVRSVTQELLSRHPKINYLVMTPGFTSLNGRNETEEGLDTKLAVHYYSRWKFTNDLLPALNQAKREGEDAKVISVFSAGQGGRAYRLK
ncbi:hypothetical protein NP233_g1377 [Leucocoprinus birnbaumii]|uniref:Uncharacterized protein n=1 Tax=Leucocoprinus birnbaumii TaxID=56174 RepID=A0AAD5W2P9_9AGAR|nr:hypothetical protein NP233_g1377 [Leucocoprinus birnbaumii]